MLSPDTTTPIYHFLFSSLLLCLPGFSFCSFLWGRPTPVCGLTTACSLVISILCLQPSPGSRVPDSPYFQLFPAWMCLRPYNTTHPKSSSRVSSCDLHLRTGIPPNPSCIFLLSSPFVILIHLNLGFPTSPHPRALSTVCTYLIIGVIFI